MARLRRAPGEGSVFYSESMKRWIWRAVVGKTPTGYALYRSGRCRTQGEAMQAKRAAEKLNEAPDRDRTTLSGYLDHWLERVAAPTVRENTLTRYRQVVRTHLVPRLGGIRMRELTAPDISRAWAKMREEGVSPAMIGKASQVLSSAMSAAVREGVINASPTAKATRPKVEDVTIEVFTDEEATAILNAAKGHRLGALFAMALGTGMRQGELFALRWEHISNDLATVQVRQTVTNGNKIGPPKSARGIRVIDLPTFVRDALPPRGTGLVFADEKGGLLSRTNFIRRDHRGLLAKAGVRYRKFHTFRHTHASRLLSAGVDVPEVARRLGDKIETVMRCYAHWMPTWKGTAGVLDGIYGS